MSRSLRLTKLDGLRGILSIIVALNHSFLILAIPGFANIWGQNILIWHDWQSKLQQTFMLLGNGGFAVTAFFVLSGLVMGISLTRVRMDPMGIVGFYLKRFTRLYPAYFFLIVFSALYLRLGFVYRVYPAASSWFQWWMNFDMTVAEFFRNAFFISISLGGITWTLRVIVIASLLLPFFYYLTRKTLWYLDLIVALVLIYLSFNLLNFSDFRDLRYLYMFFAGLMIPKFKSLFQTIPSWLFYLTLPLCLFVMMDLRYLTDEYLGGVGETLIAWYLVGLMTYGTTIKFFDVLDSKFLLYLGKVSYSLYLIHFSVLYLVAKLMFDLLPGFPYTENYLVVHLILFGVTLTLATGLSVLVNKYLEEPSIHLANSISRKFHRS